MQDTKAAAILFDLDGTLVDSLRDIADAMNAVLEVQGCPVHPVEAYKTFVGDGMEWLVRRTVPAEFALSGNRLQEWVTAMKAEYAKRWKNHTTPYKGIPDMLAERTREGWKMGVLSNKPDAFTREVVAWFFPDISWACVRGAREGVPVKPAPDAATEILSDWNLSPGQVWYVGDTSVDIKTAQNAGMPSVGVTWGFRDLEELRSAGADQILHDPAEINPSEWSDKKLVTRVRDVKTD